MTDKTGMHYIGLRLPEGVIKSVKQKLDAHADLLAGKVLKVTLDAKLLNGVTTSNAGQAAKRPLNSGLKLDKAYSLLKGWKPRTVEQAVQHWLANQRGKALGD